MTTDTTTLDYWLNWRFLLCLIWVVSCMVIAALMIWKCETFGDSKKERSQSHEETKCSLYADEAWMPCLKGLHTAWLLAFRIFGFVVLFTLLVVDLVVDGVGVLYFYTQWTFTLVTIYFGLGVVLSFYGCFYSNKVGHDHVALDAERGAYVAPTYDENGNTCNPNQIKYMPPSQQHYVRQRAGRWGYIFQVLFQMNAGAVILTDCVFWLIIYPFLSANDRSLSVLKIVTHSINAVFLLGDTVLNGLQFPWFRIAYFILWTGTFVIFQWVVHVFVSIRWPYPILELSSPYAPLWYLAVALMHLPCYGFFYLLIKIKGYFLSRCFPHAYYCLN